MIHQKFARSTASSRRWLKEMRAKRSDPRKHPEYAAALADAKKRLKREDKDAIDILLSGK